MNSTYHLVFNCQTEVLKHYLDDYILCFVTDNSRHWLQYLHWAEWHYNTTWQYAIQMALYATIYSLPPMSLVGYVVRPSNIHSLMRFFRRTPRSWKFYEQTSFELRIGWGIKPTLATQMSLSPSDSGFTSNCNLSCKYLLHHISILISCLIFGPFQILVLSKR